MGTLRHKEMISWDDDIGVYYFRKDLHKIMDPHGPVHKCLKRGILRTVGTLGMVLGVGERGTSVGHRGTRINM